MVKFVEQEMLYTRNVSSNAIQPRRAERTMTTKRGVGRERKHADADSG